MKYFVMNNEYEVLGSDGDDFNGYDGAVEFARKKAEDAELSEQEEIFICQSLEKFVVEMNVRHEKIE